MFCDKLVRNGNIQVQVYQLMIESCHLEIALFYEVSAFGQVAGILKHLFTSKDVVITTKND